MFSPLLGSDIREETLLPCYFFFGEETFLADEFVDQVRDLIASTSEEEFHIDRFYLDDVKWSDILDTARTVPFLFHHWRILVVKLPERKAGLAKGVPSGGMGRGRGKISPTSLTSTVEKILKQYFSDPPARTIMIIIQGGKIKKGDSLVRFFASLPPSAVVVKEIRGLKGFPLKKWVERKTQSLGKALTEEAWDRLFTIIGSDLRLLSNEIEKLSLYTGERRVIDEGDVNAVTAWIKNFEHYELDDVLVDGRCEDGLVILNKLFTEGYEPEVILGRMAAFFQNVLKAQTWLREKSHDRKEIFKTFFPYILEIHKDLYQRKYDGFFGVVDGLSGPDLNTILNSLQKVDGKVKTSDRAVSRTALETFLVEYCFLRGKKRPISKR